jgi:hypothetical protein
MNPERIISAQAGPSFLQQLDTVISLSLSLLKSAMNVNSRTGTSVCACFRGFSCRRMHISCEQAARRRRDECDSTGFS